MDDRDDISRLSRLKKRANRLPLLPGVYIMKNKNDEIIYIGKAKALKNRVTQYFGGGSGHTAKVRKMVSNVDHFEYIVCAYSRKLAYKTESAEIQHTFKGR